MDQRELDALVSRELLLEEQKNTTRRSLSFGMKQNPDEYAGAVKLGKETKTSTDFALKHKNDLELKKRMQVFPLDSFVRDTPRTAEFISNPENAAIAHDDVDSMSFIEKAIGKVVDYGRAAGKGVIGDVIGGTLSGVSTALDVGARAIDRPIRNLFGARVADAFWYEPLRVEGIYLDPLDALKQGGKGFKDLGNTINVEKSRQGLDTDVVQGIGQLGGQIASILLTGGAAGTTMLFAQGTDVMADKVEKDNASQAAKDTAILLGGPITAITEKYGLDKILNRVPPNIKNRTLRFIADKVVAGGIEAGQEIAEGLLMDLTRRVLTNENAPILEGAMKEGGVAALSAAIVRSALGVRGYRQAKQQEELIVALSEGGKNSKLLQRMPEKYQELIASITKDGDVNNVFIPVGQFNTFFQSQEIDPAEAATKYGATNYSEAEALGTDVVIPIEKFAAEVAPRDDLQGLLPDVKFRQGDRTARERQQDLIDEKAREEELIASAQASVGEIQTPVLQQIKTDMEGQLIATGMERTTAEANAIQYAKVINSFAVSEGIDPLELHQQYGLGVTRPLPDVLTRDTRADINIDPILDTLRNGTVATDEQIFGKSLVEFVREQGGIQPTGELLDADYNNRPFQRNLVQKDGLTADQIAERAIEAGYFSGKTFGDITEADIYDALDEELRGGNLTLAPKNFNEQLLNQRDQYNQLGEYLNSLGIDLRAITDNNQVRQLIQQAAGTVGLQDQVNQFFQTIEGGKNATTGDLDKVNPDVRDAVLSRMARLPIEEQQRIRDNLEEHKGTAWAAAAVKGMAYREMLERAMAGQDISALENNAIWGAQDMSATKLIKSFKKVPEHGDKILKVLMDSYEFIGGNRKAENDISTSFTNCDPSTACATHCYAAGSNARPNEIAKSEFTEFMLEYFPDQMADKIAGDYMATAAGKAGLALRLNDKGDLSAAQVTLVNNLNARGVAIQVFSKRPELLRQLSDINLKMLSVDSTNIDVARANTDLRLAVTITDDMTQDMLKEINDRVSVYLPVNLKGKAWTAEELQAAFPDLYQQMKRETLCPVDGGRKTTKPDTSFVNILDRTSEKNVWTCTACDYTGAAGCFNGDRKTNQRKASVVMVSDLQKELQTKRVRKELQANLDALLELGGIDGELHKQLSEALSSGQRAAQSIAGYSSETGTVEGSGGAAEAFAASGDRTEQTLGGDTKLYQSVESQQWQEGLPIVDDGNDEYQGGGAVFRAYHGTTHSNIEIFKRTGNAEGYLGEGPYFTTTAEDASANYAGVGPDLTSRIEREVDMLSSSLENDDSFAETIIQDYFDANNIEIEITDANFADLYNEYGDKAVRFAAESKLKGETEGLMMPVFVKTKNPADTTGKSQDLTYEVEYNEDGDIESESGTLLDWIEATQSVGGDYGVDVDGYISALLENGESVGMDEAFRLAYKHLGDAYDDNGNRLMPGAVFTEIAREAGYDSVIMDADLAFGSGKRGFGGIRLPGMEGVNPSTLHIVPFKPEQVKSVFNERPTNDPSILKQGEGLSDKRGYIQFGAKRKFNIALLEKANLSTFLHETGHFYLEVMGDLAERADASDRIKEDYAKVLKYLGLTSRAELTLDGKAPDSAEYKRAVEAHEMFARSNEAYLMEGKAPSEELRNVFQKFRSWLNIIYKELSALNVNLTKEIREVFDRMYATDAEIQQAQNSVITVEMFATAADMGVSEAEFQAYKKAVEQTVETGKEALQAKLMKDLQREQAEWWKKAKEEMRAEVEVEVDLTPVYAAFKTLTEGKLEDGTPIRLNKESLVEKYGEQYLKRLPRSFGRIYTREGGMDTESAAEFLGFDSGDALIEALAGMKPRNEYINAEVDRRMRERYGDMLTDGSMSEEAAIALHNSQRENALLIELKALRRKQREAAPFVQVERNRQRQERQASRAALDVPPASAFRAAAQSLIDQMAVRDLNPYKYLQASRRASKESSSALVRGDAQLAGDAKQREILNHFMYLEATKAKEEADAVLKYAQRFEKGTTREQMGKAGADYLEQIDAILDRYEFRRVPLSKIDKRKSLSDWIDAQEAQGLEPNVDPRLLNEARSVNYREISMGELRGIRDTVKNIEHLARLKNKLVTKRKEIEFKDAIAELVASAENNGQRRILPPDLSALTMREKAADKVSRLDAQLLKMEQIVEWLDGGRVDGPWHTYLWNDIAQAQADENDLHRTLTTKIVQSLEQMPKAHRKSMLDVYDIPGIGKVTRKYIISMALNMGNQENIDKMMRGHGWSMSTIETALSKLSDEDWRFVQDTWNNINSLWPQIVELEKRMTGVAPKKVEAQPYTVRRNGQEVMTLEGGYFPLVYDPRFSEVGAKQETGNLSQMFEQGYVRATTSKGHTEARKEGFAAPLQLDFEQVLSQHTAKVIKDLTHREAIVAANKILTNSEIRNVLQETLGTAYEQQMLPWLRSVVNDKNGGAVQGLGDFSRFMMSLRANTVAAVMGFKATTAIMQISGLSASLDKVGKKDLAVEVAHFMRHPIEMTNTVRELSGEMRNRPQSLDRDIRGQLNMMIGNNSLLSDAQRFAFHGIAMADTMVTVPTWMAAYKAAIREGKSEEVAILEGDAAVRLTQGAGGAKDLSAVQRNNELMKALTMFYSYFNVLYNRMRDMGRDVQSIQDMPKFLSRAFFTVMIPAVMGDLIVGRGPDDEEDYPAWIARKVLMYPLMSIPLLRDIASSLESGYDYKFTPLASGLEKLYKLGSTVKKTVSDEKDMEWGSFAVKAAETIGYLAGVPGTAQVSATGKYLWRVSEGEEEADNFAELLFYAAMGKRKEQK